MPVCQSRSRSLVLLWAWLLHISEISESRVKNVRDELNEGDQIMVKVLALEGNKIKLSRRAILKEQREKMAAAKPE